MLTYKTYSFSYRLRSIYQFTTAIITILRVSKRLCMTLLCGHTFIVKLVYNISELCNVVSEFLTYFILLCLNFLVCDLAFRRRHHLYKS